MTDHPGYPAVTHRQVRANGIELHLAMAGNGPVVLMIHGNPGLWYSWRHQFAPLAAAGFTAVALDNRGFGRSSRPREVGAYDSETIRADLLGVLDALGAERAFIVGQDFGSQYAWNLAVRSSERVRGVVGMVPFDFDLAGRFCEPSGAVARLRPSERFAAVAREHFFHMHYYQQPGPAEAEFAAAPREYLTRLFHVLSAQGDLLGSWGRHPSEGTGYLDVLPKAPPLPWPWMSQADFDYYLSEFLAPGPELAFVGPLNSYRTADRNWEIGERWAEADVTPPALFLCGAGDAVLRLLPPDALERQRRRFRDLRGEVLIEGAGHFVQQEKPCETTAAILEFLRALR